MFRRIETTETRLLPFLYEINAKSIFLLCHHNADPDAVCSAYALSKFLKRTISKADVTIVAPKGLSKLSKQVLRKISVKIEVSPSIELADVVVLLDTSTLQQLDRWKFNIEKCGKPIIVIDHHAVHPETAKLANLLIVNEHSSSTCEVVFGLFKEASVKPEVDEALALFAGIAYDTKHFSIASSSTFLTVAELIKLGARAEDAMPLLEFPMDNAERVARLKAGNRLQLVKLGEWILALSSVSSYQASAARGLIGLGAHVAIVGGVKGKRLRLNMRSSKQFYKKTKIHLGRDIALPLGKYVGGMGGGHDTSAGVNGEGDVKVALNECAKLLRGKFYQLLLSSS